MNQDISEQILSLASAELRRMETENSAWQGAYSGMSLVDGDTTDRKISIVYGTRNALTRDFPKDHWIVCLQPSIPRVGRSTIMAFSKKSLALVYFGSANDNGVYADH